MLLHNDSAVSVNGYETHGSALTDVTQQAEGAHRHGQSNPDDELFMAIGRFIHGWGTLELQLEQKIAQLRQVAGDVRIIGGRTRPTIGKMLAELRAIISMRARRNNVDLARIAEIECTIQKVDRFRMLVIQGFQRPADHPQSDQHLFLCRDAKNNIVSISLDELDDELVRLDHCRIQLLAL